MRSRMSTTYTAVCVLSRYSLTSMQRSRSVMADALHKRRPCTVSWPSSPVKRGYASAVAKHQHAMLQRQERSRGCYLGLLHGIFASAAAGTPPHTSSSRGTRSGTAGMQRQQRRRLAQRTNKATAATAVNTASGCNGETKDKGARQKNETDPFRVAYRFEEPSTYLRAVAGLLFAQTSVVGMIGVQVVAHRVPALSFFASSLTADIPWFTIPLAGMPIGLGALWFLRFCRKHAAEVAVNPDKGIVRLKFYTIWGSTHALYVNPHDIMVRSDPGFDPKKHQFPFWIPPVHGQPQQHQDGNAPDTDTWTLDQACVLSDRGMVLDAELLSKTLGYEFDQC